MSVGAISRSSEVHIVPLANMLIDHTAVFLACTLRSTGFKLRRESSRRHGHRSCSYITGLDTPNLCQRVRELSLLAAVLIGYGSVYSTCILAIVGACFTRYSIETAHVHTSKMSTQQASTRKTRASQGNVACFDDGTGVWEMEPRCLRLDGVPTNTCYVPVCAFRTATLLRASPIDRAAILPAWRFLTFAGSLRIKLSSPTCSSATQSHHRPGHW